MSSSIRSFPIYAGEIRCGFYHGQGRCEWSDDGTFYEGDFIMGQATGKGTINSRNELIYLGEVKNFFRHGRGVLSHIDGHRLYDGDWLLGKRDGFGKQIYNATKNIYYTGDWKNNKRHGLGVMHFGSGSVYTGFFANDQRRGIGVLSWSSGHHYLGSFVNNLPSGYGEFTYPSTQSDISVKGEGALNHVSSQRKSFVSVGLNMYRGQLARNLRHGYGTFYYADGSRYIGMWRNNVKQGPGIFLGANGSVSFRRFDVDKMVTEVFASCETVENGQSVAPLQIHVEDLLFDGAHDVSGTEMINEMKEWNRLFLKYASSTRRFYFEKASSEGNNCQPKFASNSHEDDSLHTRVFRFCGYVSHMKSTVCGQQSMRVSQVLNLFRGSGILTSTFDSDDALSCLRQLRQHRHAVAIKLVQDHGTKKEDIQFIRLFQELGMSSRTECVFSGREARTLLSEYDEDLRASCIAQWEFCTSSVDMDKTLDTSASSTLHDRDKDDSECCLLVTESELCEWMLRCVSVVGMGPRNQEIADKSINVVEPVNLLNSFHRFLHERFNPYSKRQSLEELKSLG